MKPVVLNGKRIILRPLRMSDAEKFLPYANDPILTKYLTFGPPMSLRKEQEFVSQSLSAWRDGTKFIWAITLNDSDEPIGSIDIHELYTKDSYATLGIWIAPVHQHRGIGFEACRLALGFAFRKLKLNKVQYAAYRPNYASKKLAEKLGCKLDGILRQHVRKGKNVYDAYVFSILRSEWKA